MFDVLKLFDRKGGYPEYTPIEPESLKIEDTEITFDLPNSYEDKSTKALSLTSTPDIPSKALQLTSDTAKTRSATTLAAVATTDTTPVTDTSLSIDTKKLELSDSVIKKAQTPAEKAATYLNRAQFATGIEAAAQIAQGMITLSNANAGVDAVQRTARMREVNLAENEAVMYEHMRDSMAQLDMISAAKNVDLSSSAITGAKERGLRELGKDIQSKQLAIKFQNAVDKYNALKQKEAAKAQGNLQIVQGVMTAASLFI